MEKRTAGSPQYSTSRGTGTFGGAQGVLANAGLDRIALEE
jgi:hypothetical protein